MKVVCQKKLNFEFSMQKRQPCSVAHWTSLAVKKYNLFAFETLCGRQTKGWAIHWDACQTEVALGHLGLSFSAVSTSLWKPNHKEVL
jgi:hypothetical protein